MMICQNEKRIPLEKLFGRKSVGIEKEIQKNSQENDKNAQGIGHNPPSDLSGTGRSTTAFSMLLATPNFWSLESKLQL